MLVLKREPVSSIGIDLILNVRAGAETHTAADGRQSDATRALVIHAQPGHEIDAAFDAREALEQAPVFLQIIYQRENFGRVAAHIEADRGSLPVDHHGVAGL